ncbi:MAG: SCO family protein [Flavobacteriaceae bacterium]|nr:SCO family protein [Flavobacteriaceae bacterium]
MEFLKFFKKSLPVLIFMFVFSAVSIFVFYKIQTPKVKLPIINPIDVNPRLVDPSVRLVRNRHKIKSFNMIDQNGDSISALTYKNKIYVADFFFTRCESICPIMTNYMTQVQDAYKTDDEIMFLSFSVTPSIDSISVLKEYALKNGVIDTKWHLVTGNKKDIYKLARQSFLAALDKGDGGKQDFIHTEQFVLVDKQQRIRGFYDGTDKKQVNQLIEDIRILKKEYKKQ